MTKLFWVCWISNGSNGRAYAMALSSPCLTLVKAVGEITRIAATEDIVCAWVEERDSDGNMLGIRFHKIYVDTFGNRIKEVAL